MNLNDIQQENKPILEKNIRGEYVGILSCSNKVLLVKRDFDEGLQYVGEKWQSGILAQAFPFSCGFGRAKKNLENGFIFYGKNGRHSEEFFRASDYHDGVALVQPVEDGEFYLRDKNGKLSQPFECAGEYKDGFYLVKCPDEKGYRFVSNQGKTVSEMFEQATSYQNGFAKVRFAGDIEFSFRDMLGRISENETASGRDFYLFVNGVVSLKDLNKKYFEDEVFTKAVIKILKQQAKEKYREAMTNHAKNTSSY